MPGEGKYNSEVGQYGDRQWRCGRCLTRCKPVPVTSSMWHYFPVSPLDINTCLEVERLDAAMV